jgi:two-component system, NarL family, sensor histidine kinase UhpB
VARIGGSGDPSVGRLLDADNAERHRLSAALHDDAIQLLTVAVMRLDLLAGALDDERAIAMTEEVRRVVREALDHTRTFCADLDAPVLQRDGLAAAITELGEQLFSDVPTQLTVEAQLRYPPTITAASVVYRLTREALSNARHHAEASVVRVELRGDDDGIESVVRDDGSGFVPSAAGPHEHGGVMFGLALASNLVVSVGGRWSIEGRPGSGTAVTFWVPASL